MNRERSYEVYALPLPEGGNPAFYELLDDMSPELGRAGGELICWIPVDNPRKIDKVHRLKRSREQEKQELADAEFFEERSQEVGGAPHYIRHENAGLAEDLSALGISRPIVLITFHELPGQSRCGQKLSR